MTVNFKNYSLGLAITSESTKATEQAAVLLHGLTASPQEMELLGKALADIGMYCEIPCFTGHGASDLSSLRKATSSDWILDAEQALSRAEKNSKKPVVIIGLSFGAIVGLYLALNNQARISGLVALSPPFFLNSKRMEIITTALSFLPNVVLNLLGTIPKNRKGAATPVLPRLAYSAHSIGAVARLKYIVRKVKKEFSSLSLPLLVLSDPLDHHISQASIDFVTANSSGARVEVDWFTDGAHELLAGKSYKEVQARIIQFIKSLS